MYGSICVILIVQRTMFFAGPNIANLDVNFYIHVCRFCSFIRLLTVVTQPAASLSMHIFFYSFIYLFLVISIIRTVPGAKSRPGGHY